MSDYRNLNEIGRGGFATVFLCERVPDNARYARKILNANAKPGIVERFRQEVRILSTLDHPNIVRVLDSQTDESAVLVRDALVQDLSPGRA